MAACSSSVFAEVKPDSQKGTPLANPLPEVALLQYLAPEGKVRKGEIVAVLDCTSYAAKLREAQKAVSEKQAALREIDKNLEAAKAESGIRIPEAELEVADAERTLGKYVEGDGPAAELALQLALHDAEAAFKLQSERFAARDRLLEEGFIQKVEYNNEEVLLKRTRLVLEAAKLKLSTFTKYDKEQTVAQHSRTLETKQTEVKKLRVKIAAQEAASNAALERGRKALVSLEAERDRWKELLQKAVVRAPGEGVFSPGEKINRGEEVLAGQVIGFVRD